MDLAIVRIKPNPVGKDRPGHSRPSAEQLAGEWVDFRNDSGRALSLNNVGLYHVAYPPNAQPYWTRITGFIGVLQPSQIVRVHAGQKRDLSIIRQEDKVGAHHHAFTGEDAYVWNNRQGDRPRLLNESANAEIDQAWYAPNPPEGVVLVRQGDQLVVGQARAVNW